MVTAIIINYLNNKYHFFLSVPISAMCDNGFKILESRIQEAQKKDIFVGVYLFIFDVTCIFYYVLLFYLYVFIFVFIF